MTAAGGRKSTSAEDVQWKWDDKEMKNRWLAFAKFGSHEATEITGKNFDKWLKDAGVLDSKTITTTMTGIAFSKLTGGKKKTLSYKDTKEVLVKVAEDRASKSKKVVQEELDVITEKLAKLEAPTLHSATKAESKGVYDRLCDTSKYTGSHKERFDETGKGRGKAGREDIPDGSVSK